MIRIKKSITKYIDKQINWWLSFVNKDNNKAINYGLSFLDYMVYNGDLSEEGKEAYISFYDKKR